MNRATTEGSILLGDVAARAEWLMVTCGKCERRGRLRVADLLARYGRDYPMTHLRHDLAGARPRLAPEHNWRTCATPTFPSCRASWDCGEAPLAIVTCGGT